MEAVKTGGWILLDEINLATSETLDCLSGLLEEGKESVVLLEKGFVQYQYLNYVVAWEIIIMLTENCSQSQGTQTSVCLLA